MSRTDLRRALRTIMGTFLCIAATAYVPGAHAGDTNGPAWKADLGEEIKAIRYLDDHTHVLFASNEYVWLYDIASGKKVWNEELKDFNKKGLRYVVQGSKFFVSASKSVQCYDVMTGSKLWETPVPGVDQDDYRTREEISSDALMIGYEHQRVLFNTNDGKILLNVTINEKAKEKGAPVLFDFAKEHKDLVLLKGDKVGLYDLVTGAQLFAGENYEPNYDLVKKDLPWYYQMPDDKALLMVLDDEVVVIDAAGNKEMFRRKLDFDDSHQVLIPTTQGCAVLTKEKIVHINMENGSVAEAAIPQSEIRTMQLFNVAGKDILLVSLKDKVMAIDIGAGTTLWQSRDGDPKFEGFVHRYVRQDGSDALVMVATGRKSGDEEGTTLYAMRLDLTTGAVKYRTPVALGKEVVSYGGSLLGSIGKAYLAMATLGLSTIGGGPDFGYSNIGFDYDVTEQDGKLIVAIVTSAEMLNPETRKDGGEGFCEVDESTGAALYRSYFPILDGSDRYTSVAYVDKQTVYLTGKNSLIAFDLAAGKKLWSIGKELDDAQVVDMSVIDGVLYAKCGKKTYSAVFLVGDQSFSAHLNNTATEDKLDVNEESKTKPFEFLAIEPTSGKILWRAEAENDPSLAEGDFGLTQTRSSFSFHEMKLASQGYGAERSNIVKPFEFSSYYNSGSQELYYCDLENVYALKLGRDGGKVDWQFSLKKNDVGAIEFEKAFAYNKRDHKLTQPLRLEYSGGKLVVYGPDGIASIDPASGKARWTHEWSFDWKKVRYFPQLVDQKLVYCVDSKLTRIDLNGGSVDWQVKLDKGTGLYASPTNDYIITLNNKEADGFPLK
ncbi:MAG TPA: PQQ-binding-like beta-propeller repeat protein [Bacteroidota bacterium]|nr:PQQ-binding-like beta-propeller repeat protein [Bacteroidota bacterium]